VHQFGLNYTSKSVRYECQRLPLTAISLRFIVDSHGLRKQELVGVHKKEGNIYTYTHDAFLRNWTSAVADSCINLVRAGFPSKGPAVHKIFNGTCPHNAAVQLLLGTWTWFKILWTDQWPSISSFVVKGWKVGLWLTKVAMVRVSSPNVFFFLWIFVWRQSDDHPWENAEKLTIVF